MYRPAWMTDELEAWRDSVRRFFQAEAAPNLSRWNAEGIIDRDFWRRAAEAGLICTTIPEEFGGIGASFLYEAIIYREQARAQLQGWGNPVHSSICAHYILAYGTDEQKRRWLPDLCSGRKIAAIAMTEPGTGSDLKALTTTATEDGADYIINGQKLFITNGQTADLIIVAARTDKTRGTGGISLVVVEAPAEGFRRGANLAKLGQHHADTSELFFHDVCVPKDNLLGGQPGNGFGQLMAQLPRERLICAVIALGAMEAIIEITVDYVEQRKLFGGRLADLQNTRFTLAECHTEASIFEAFVDQCMAMQAEGQLTNELAAMAKWWGSDRQFNIANRCLQLFGGMGYMTEQRIAREFADARAQMIYGGANEILKEVVARGLVSRA
ncbi:MAG: acyl-CoA dehydrogenase family protein [Sphingomonas sp.]|nr:acyl-CoA dehydrogenase family protein [Sphingomonas sp.]